MNIGGFVQEVKHECSRRYNAAEDAEHAYAVVIEDLF